MIAVGRQYRFDYIWASDPSFGGSELRARTGRTATVVRVLRSGDEYDYEGDEMFEIVFRDGFTAHAFDFELVEVAG